MGLCRVLFVIAAHRFMIAIRFLSICGALLWMLCPSVACAASSDKAIPLSPHRLEWGAIGGPAFNVDTGLEIAGFAHFAQFHPDVFPYRWRMRFKFKIAFRSTPVGIELPVHDYNLEWDLPGLWQNRLRIRVKAGFSTLIAQYYGLGNRSDGTRHWKRFDPEKDKLQYVRELRRYQYRITSPTLRMASLLRLGRGWFAFATLSWDYILLQVFEDSVLNDDRRASLQATDSRSQLLYGVGNHGLVRGEIGLVWDTRDNEFAPNRGWFHSISLRGSPGVVVGTRFLFAGANATLQWYQTLWPGKMVLALRLVGDSLWGQVPFHQLTGMGGFNNVSSFGGGSSVRGVRAQRFHGHHKVFGNLELRARLVRFFAFRRYLAVGLLAFVDAGRVWMPPDVSLALDGSDPGIHIGVGGGLRFHWGKSLIIRFDIAWSQDADPIGFYFNLGHLF
jgi:outer membrane protein assembly factor BamA